MFQSFRFSPSNQIVTFSFNPYKFATLFYLVPVYNILVWKKKTSQSKASHK